MRRTALRFSILIILLMTGTQVFAQRKFNITRDTNDRTKLKGTLSLAYLSSERIRAGWDYAIALQTLASTLSILTDVDAEEDGTVFLSSQRIHAYPVLFMMAEESFYINDLERTNLRSYFDRGGFLVVDNAYAGNDSLKGGYNACRKLVMDVLGKKAVLDTLTLDHEINSTPFSFTEFPSGWDNTYKTNSKFLTDTEQEKSNTRDTLLSPGTIEYVVFKNRIVAVFLGRGYLPFWIRNKDYGLQVRYGINVVTYALKQKNGMVGINNGW